MTIRSITIIQQNVLHWRTNYLPLANTYLPIDPNIILINSHGNNNNEKYKLFNYFSFFANILYFFSIYPNTTIEHIHLSPQQLLYFSSTYVLFIMLILKKSLRPSTYTPVTVMEISKGCLNAITLNIHVVALALSINLFTSISLNTPDSFLQHTSTYLCDSSETRSP